MWYLVWHCVETVFLNPWVTNYVMPVFIGFWLAIITANIIYIRDMKARVLTELIQLQLRLGSVDFDTHNEWDARTTLMYQALLLIGEDLTRRGYFASRRVGVQGTAAGMAFFAWVL